jgi:hypothetical protein
LSPVSNAIPRDFVASHSLGECRNCSPTLPGRRTSATSASKARQEIESRAIPPIPNQTDRPHDSLLHILVNSFGKRERAIQVEEQTSAIRGMWYLADCQATFGSIQVSQDFLSRSCYDFSRCLRRLTALLIR